MENNKSSSRSTNTKQMTTNEGLPSLKKDLQNAKLFLLQSGPNGDSLFQHLANVISKVIDERPENVIDYFEQFSEHVRLESFEAKEKLLDAYKEPTRLAIAQQLLPMIIEKSQQLAKDQILEDGEVQDEPEEDDEEDEDVIYQETPKDLFELQFYWNLLGIGIAREDVFLLSCSMAKFQVNPDVASCRFWGKMLGLKNDYFLVECALTESGVEKQIDAIETAINIQSFIASEEFVASFPALSNASMKTVNDDDDKMDGSNSKADAEENPAGWNFTIKAAESSYAPPIEVPAEPTGSGVNRHVFFVCTDLTRGDWIELPPATPYQINISRRIKKYLTGDLDHAISSYPPFPGTERNYLRALIARISASTSIAPRNFYKISSGEDDDADDFDADYDDANNDKPIKVNASYRPLPVEKLAKLDYWEHCKPEILKQGRVSYFDGSVLNMNDDNESDLSTDEEEAETANNGIPETAIPLFTLVSGDRSTNSISSWTAKVVESVVVLQSRVWPGAFSFAKDRTCDSIYLGFGFKNTDVSLPAIPPLAADYPFGLDVIEGEDGEERELSRKETETPFIDEDEVDENQ